MRPRTANGGAFGLLFEPASQLIWIDVLIPVVCAGWHDADKRRLGYQLSGDVRYGRARDRTTHQPAAGFEVLCGILKKSGRGRNVLDDLEEGNDVEGLSVAVFVFRYIFKSGIEVGELRWLDSRVAALVGLCNGYTSRCWVDGKDRRGARVAGAGGCKDAAAASDIKICPLLICRMVLREERLEEVEAERVHKMEES